VKLSNIARSLKEESSHQDETSVAQLKDSGVGNRTDFAVSQDGDRDGRNTVLCLDLSDIRKEYARRWSIWLRYTTAALEKCMRAIGCAMSPGRSERQ